MKKRENLSSRLYEVENFLCEKPRTQKEISDYFNVDRTTVRRAIDKLSWTLLIEEEKDGRNTVYRVGKFENPSFTPLELSTLILAQESIIATGEKTIGSPFAESAKSLIEKVREKINPNLKLRLDALSKVFGSAVTPNKDFSEHFPTIEMLVKAAIDCVYVDLTYQNLYDDSAKTRRFAPYSVYFDPDGATLKVLGFDEKRQAIIPFSIDHIKKITLLKETFERPLNYDLRQFLEKYCFNGIHGEPITVRLKVSGITSRIFLERKFHISQKIIKTRKKDNNESLIVELFVAEGRGLERFILSWMPDVEVISPIKLREKLKNTLSKSSEKHK